MFEISSKIYPLTKGIFRENMFDFSILLQKKLKLFFEIDFNPIILDFRFLFWDCSILVDCITGATLTEMFHISNKIYPLANGIFVIAYNWKHQNIFPIHISFFILFEGESTIF